MMRLDDRDMMDMWRFVSKLGPALNILQLWWEKGWFWDNPIASVAWRTVYTRNPRLYTCLPTNYYCDILWLRVFDSFCKHHLQNCLNILPCYALMTKHFNWSRLLPLCVHLFWIGHLEIPSGKLTVCYGQWPIYGGFAYSNGDFPTVCKRLAEGKRLPIVTSITESSARSRLSNFLDISNVSLHKHLLWIEESRAVGTKMELSSTQRPSGKPT